MEFQVDYSASDSVFVPQPGPQTAAILCPADLVFFGGARGGGKSYTAIGKQIVGALTHGHNWSGLFLRKHFKHFADLRREMDGLIRKGLPAIRVGGDNQTNVLKFDNGAKVLFTAVERAEQLEFFQGQSLQLICIEEICQFSFVNEMIDKLKACLRSASGVHCQMFLTGNPGGPGHCVPHGDVLTSSGWKKIEDVCVGDMVYSVDKSDNLVLRRVTSTFGKHYEGEMAYVTARGLRMICTPNHKVAKVGGVKADSGSNQFTKRDAPLFSLVEFNDLPGQAYIKRHASNFSGERIEGFSPEYFKTRKRRLTQPTWVSGDDYCSFMGWFLSEGYAARFDIQEKKFGICQSKEPQRGEIRRLLDKMGFKYSEQENQFIVCAPCWWNYLSQFGACRDKFIPYEIKNAPKDQMLLFITAAMDGDGHWSKRGQSGTYYTLSKTLADDMSEVLIKSGFVVFINSRQRPGRDGISYEVYFKPPHKCGGQEILTGNHIYDVPTKTVRKTSIERKFFSGSIFCIEVEDTHNFIIRQEGSVWVSGNSAVKARFISPAPGGGVPLKDGDDMAVFIPSRVEDNKVLCENDPKYVERLRSIRDPQLRKAWLEGDWDAVVGGFFDDVWEPRKHVVRSFRVPKHWPRLCGMDWGSAAPFAVGWFAVSGGEEVASGLRFPKGALVQYDEWYGCVKGEPNVGMRLTSDQVAHGILERERQRGESELMFDRIADTSIFDQVDGPSIGERFADQGVVWRKADKRRLPGWETLRSMLRGKEVSEGDFLPWLYVTENCRYQVELLPTLQRDENNWEDLESDGVPDHAVDMLRYICTARAGAGVSYEDYVMEEQRKAHEIHNTVTDWEEIEARPSPEHHGYGAMDVPSEVHYG